MKYLPVLQNLSSSMAANTNGAVNGKARSAFDPSSAVPLFLDGKEITTDVTFEIVSPNDSKVCWKASSASEQDALNAIASAEKAFKSWSKTKPATRRDIFLKAAQLLKEKEEEAYIYSNTETGAAQSMFGFEFGLAIEGLLTIAGLIPSVQGAVMTPSEDNKSAIMLREPYGVCLGIAPWNAPHVGLLSFFSIPYVVKVSNVLLLGVGHESLDVCSRHGQYGDSEGPRSVTSDLLELRQGHA